LLGIEMADHQKTAAGTPGKFDNLLAGFRQDLRPAARNILEKYDQLERDLVQKVNGTVGPAEQAQLHHLYHQKLAELRNILSPAELEQFELRHSPVASNIRNRGLIGFDPTEAEFIKIFRIHKEFEEQFGFGWRPANAEDQVRFQQGRETKELLLQNALGAERYAGYLRSQDSTYQRLAGLADFHGLPLQAAIQVHDIRAAVLQHAGQIAEMQHLDQPLRQALLLEIQSEAGRAITSALGQEAYQEFLSLPIGQWLRRIPEWHDGVVLGR
jgi:hypothetical protein